DRPANTGVRPEPFRLRPEGRKRSRQSLLPVSRGAKAGLGRSLEPGSRSSLRGAPRAVGPPPARRAAPRLPRQRRPRGRAVTLAFQRAGGAGGALLRTRARRPAAVAD